MTHRRFSRSLLLVSFLWVSTLAQAKSEYHLFNPTPEKQMREFVTDRPDKTEAAYTVDAGHFQFETDLATYEQDGTDESRLTVNFINLKAGITNDSDFQVVVPTFVRKESAGQSQTGFGDLTLRYKMNLMGNDGGPVALGVMPFINLPTASEDLGDGMVTGGVIVPFSFDLPYEFGLGAMWQVNYAKNAAGSGRHLEVVSSVTLGHDLIGDLAGYAEFWNLASTETWEATADFGLTYLVIPNWQLDVGVNLGLTDAAPDLNPFVGVSARF